MKKQDGGMPLWRRADFGLLALPPPTSSLDFCAGGALLVRASSYLLTTGIFRPIFCFAAYFFLSARSTKHHTRICSPETTYNSFTHNTRLAPPPDLVYMTVGTVQYEAHDEGTRDTLNDGVRTHISQRG